jgi:hypothetical protein
MFSVKISLVKGISISKTRSEFFNLKRSGDVECKIQEGIVNARIKNVTKKVPNSSVCHVEPFDFAQDRLREISLADLAALPNQIIRDSSE